MIELSDFDYLLPEKLIACAPSIPRDHSRLLVLRRGNTRIVHQHFYDIVKHFRAGDVLVLNETKVFPARLLGKKMSGGRVEILLNHELEQGLWEAIGRNLKVGEKIVFSDSKLKAVIIKKEDRVVKIRFNLSGEHLNLEIDKIGHTSLPPYIKRDLKTRDSRLKTNSDKNSYQTVYAKKRGSVAAPTAGFHFTPKLLTDIEKIGVQIEKVTLHVGLGTFAPIEVEDITQHQIHQEFFSISLETLERIKKAKKEGRRIIAVGTTTTRVLEYLFAQMSSRVEWNGIERSIKQISPLADLPAGRQGSVEMTKEGETISGWTNIFIYPGFKFKCIDGLITNFHLPKSSLLLLVSAFAGQDKIKKAYQEAINEKYRFYSYGDAMLIIK